MIQNKIKIIRLQSKDLYKVAHVHTCAFPNSVLTMLGAEAVRRYYNWQIIGGSEQLIANGAFIDNELIGFCFGGGFYSALKSFILNNLFFLILTTLAHLNLFSKYIFRKRFVLTAKILFKHVFNLVIYKKIPIKLSEKNFGILSIAVYPEYQGKGIGKELLGQAEFTASQQGFDKVNLSVGVDNEKAIRFYRNSGYKEVIQDSGSWQGYMEKDL